MRQVQLQRGDGGQDGRDSGQEEEVLETVEMNRMGRRGRDGGKDSIYESVAPRWSSDEQVQKGGNSEQQGSF